MAEAMSMSLETNNQTQNTQEFDDGETADKNEDSEIFSDNKHWGRLLSIHKLFSSIHFDRDRYSFGRKEPSDYTFCSDEIKTSKYFQTYSSHHFEIERDPATDRVSIRDFSANGTFVNGEKIGKGKSRIIQNNDEISLSSKSNRVFVFIDAKAREDLSIPTEIRRKYLFSRPIGRGSYGEVRLCFDRKSWQKFAAKIVGKKHFTHIGSQAMLFNEKMKNECIILRQLNHPCIIKIHDVEENKDAIYIILELAGGGELFDRIISGGQLNEKTTKFIFRQISLGVKYLHENNITHRDLKPENILLMNSETDETLIKITDFGLSKLFDQKSLLQTFCGTPNYLAPEILISRGSSAYTEKIDIWSLGVILYVCLVGYPPFNESAGLPPLHEQIVRGLYTFPHEFWGDISERAKDLIQRMMCVDPTRRLTIDEVLNHQWLAEDSENTARVNEVLAEALPVVRVPKRRCSTEIDQADESTNSMSFSAASKRGRYEISCDFK